MWFIALCLLCVLLVVITLSDKEINAFESRCRKALRYVFKKEAFYPFETEEQKEARFNSGVQAANELYAMAGDIE